MGSLLLSTWDEMTEPYPLHFVIFKQISLRIGTSRPTYFLTGATAAGVEAGVPGAPAVAVTGAAAIPK